MLPLLRTWQQQQENPSAVHRDLEALPATSVDFTDSCVWCAGSCWHEVASRGSFSPPHCLSFISLHWVLSSSPPYSSHADLIAVASTSVMFLVWHPAVSWPVNFPYDLLGSLALFMAHNYISLSEPNPSHPHPAPRATFWTN